MKIRSLVIATALSISTSYAATPATPVDNQNLPTASAIPANGSNFSTGDNNLDNAQAPLNKYGAVDVNANVPVSAQVPAKPANFVDPVINPLTSVFADSVPAQPSLDAKSYILVDANSGEVIAASNPNLRLAPASMTKLMLVYIAEQELNKGSIHLDDQVTVPTVAWATGGSRMFLKPGQVVSVRDLLSGIVVASGNDAAVTLATYIAGTQSAMVSMMNFQAKKLGMTDTHFTDIMGLPAPAHFSTSYDMALLGRAIVTQYPQYYSWFGQKYFQWGKITQPNFNRLLFVYQYADGLKTGSTNEAGFSLVGSAKMPNNPMRLISVVMGTPNANVMASTSAALLQYGFRFFNDQMIVPANTVMTKARIYGGDSRTVPAGVTQDLWASIPTNVQGKVTTSFNVNNHVEAPIALGQTVGTITVSINGKVINTVPLQALSEVGPGGSFDRALDKVTGWF